MGERADGGGRQAEVDRVFVLRARLEARQLRMRLESLDDGAVRHFSQIDDALGHLRVRLDAIVAPPSQSA